jgi:hypothetical protein
VVACLNDHGNHGSRDGGSNTIPHGIVFCKTHINKVNKRTNPSLMEAFLCGFGLWCKRSVTHTTYRLFLKSDLIEFCFAHATSIRQEFNNHNATIQRCIGLLIERLSDVFTLFSIDSRSDRNEPITIVRENQPCRFFANADFSCNRLFSHKTSFQDASIFSHAIFSCK